MAERELYELIAIGEERRNLEYKRSVSWNDRRTRARITKSILAMNNIRYGGYIVLGVDQQPDGAFDPVGMSAEDASSLNYDDVASYVATYADPYVQFSLSRLEREGRIFVVIQVREFDEIPTICKRSYGTDLHEGKIYTRTRGGRPESAEIRSQTEMREIIDMAVEKGIRRFYERLARAGLTLPTPVPVAPTANELFEKQREGL